MAVTWKKIAYYDTLLTVEEQEIIGRLTGGNVDGITIGIADNNMVQIDQADAASGEYCRLTANGIESRSKAETQADLDLEAGTDFPSKATFDTHEAATTGVHGAGGDTLATDADIATHAALTATHGAADIADVSDIAVDANLSATAQAAIAASHTQGTDTTLGTLTANVDFAKYQAIALVCHKGATMPADPTDGQWFLHTPTGRNVLYQYNSEWIPIISVGTMTMYVDKTDGTDDLNHGTAADASAFATVQYAVDCIPGLVGGNVVIYINAEDYDETVTIRGKKASGDYTISIYGTLALQETASSATVVAGSGATQGTVTKAGQFTGDTYANMLAYFVTDDEYRVIDSHTDDVLTLVGTAPSSTAQNVAVYDWDTTINSVVVKPAQNGVYLYALYLDTSVGLTTESPSSTFCYRCKIATTGTWGCIGRGDVWLEHCYLQSQYPVYAESSITYVWSSKVYTIAASKHCVRATLRGYVAVREGSILDASSKTGTNGIRVETNAVVGCYTSAAGGYPRIRNQAVGIYAEAGGMVKTTANNVYSGNTADETADAASFGYID